MQCQNRVPSQNIFESLAEIVLPENIALPFIAGWCSMEECPALIGNTFLAIPDD